MLNLNLPAWILLGLIVPLVLIQTVCSILYVRTLFRFQRQRAADDSLPPAAVVLSIRGPDPFLADTLTALLKQDYPKYLISIVLDDARDPARQIVDAVVAQTGATNVSISVLTNRRETCSLKCSSLIQAVEELSPEYEVVAFIDGDAKPYPSWLRDLAGPLAEPGVGVVTGNRWYMPHSSSWGSLVRYFWNAGAVVQMWFNGIVWAGSMALRRSNIDQIDLLEAWGKALSVDNTVCRQVRKHGMKVHLTPGVILLNTEQIALPTFSGWVRRQLVSAKSRSESWAVLVLHGVYLAASQAAGFCLLVVAAALGNWLAFAVTATALALYWTSSVLATMALEAGARRIARLNGQDTRWLSVATVLKLFPAIVLTHYVYAVDLIVACFCRRVSWRGVDYTILGKNNVRMVSYQPYCEVAGRKSLTSVV